MKQMTIWQRLNIAFAVLVVLLMAGGGLALWSERTLKDAERRGMDLAYKTDLIRLDLATLSDGLRGLLLDPKTGHEGEKKRRTEAEKDLINNLTFIETNFQQNAQLISTSHKLKDFNDKKLQPMQRRIMELLESNPAAALMEYNSANPELRREREILWQDLAQKGSDVRKTEAEAARATVGKLVLAIVGLLLLCLVVGRFQSSAVTVPLNRLVATLERMRRGDFTDRLDLNRRDEFGVLSDGLNRLADDLSQLVGQVQRSGIQVNTAATEIAATAREQQSTANEIAATTSEIGATSKEISATSKELVKTMNEVTHVAQETATVAGKGQTAISRMESNMRQIMDASSSITAKLAVLSEKTTNINSVVTTITKVADQTNLLSLNAAIEAEKAGEYGLGFAVVAMEIRRLADQTAVATYDIEKMVKEMQTAVSAGVMGMDKFSEEVRHGVEEIRQVSTQLAQIIHQVQTLTPRFQTVNEGMNAQATGAQQISETLTQLSEAANQTAESLRQSNLAIEQLNGAARGLQTSVARFKLTN
jgi:methyl-accepting chemotaxis protein WspA